jgi:hypothetical protein
VGWENQGYTDAGVLHSRIIHGRPQAVNRESLTHPDFCYPQYFAQYLLNTWLSCSSSPLNLWFFFFVGQYSFPKCYRNNFGFLKDVTPDSMVGIQDDKAREWQSPANPVPSWHSASVASWCGKFHWTLTPWENPQTLQSMQAKMTFHPSGLFFTILTN